MLIYLSFQRWLVLTTLWSQVSIFLVVGNNCRRLAHEDLTHEEPSTWNTRRTNAWRLNEGRLNAWWGEPRPINMNSQAHNMEHITKLYLFPPIKTPINHHKCLRIQQLILKHNGILYFHLSIRKFQVIFKQSQNLWVLGTLSYTNIKYKKSQINAFCENILNKIAQKEICVHCISSQETEVTVVSWFWTTVLSWLASSEFSHHFCN